MNKNVNLRKLEPVENNKRIYLDEAGIDNREEYPYGYCEIEKKIMHSNQENEPKESV